MRHFIIPYSCGVPTQYQQILEEQRRKQEEARKAEEIRQREIARQNAQRAAAEAAARAAAEAAARAAEQRARQEAANRAAAEAAARAAAEAAARAAEQRAKQEAANRAAAEAAARAAAEAEARAAEQRAKQEAAARAAAEQAAREKAEAEARAAETRAKQEAANKAAAEKAAREKAEAEARAAETKAKQEAATRAAQEAAAKQKADAAAKALAAKQAEETAKRTNAETAAKAKTVATQQAVEASTASEVAKARETAARTGQVSKVLTANGIEHNVLSPTRAKYTNAIAAATTHNKAVVATNIATSAVKCNTFDDIVSSVKNTTSTLKTNAVSAWDTLKSVIATPFDDNRVAGSIKQSGALYNINKTLNKLSNLNVFKTAAGAGATYVHDTKNLNASIARAYVKNTYGNDMLVTEDMFSGDSVKDRESRKLVLDQMYIPGMPSDVYAIYKERAIEGDKTAMRTILKAYGTLQEQRAQSKADAQAKAKAEVAGLNRLLNDTPSYTNKYTCVVLDNTTANSDAFARMVPVYVENGNDTLVDKNGTLTIGVNRLGGYVSGSQVMLDTRTGTLYQFALTNNTVATRAEYLKSAEYCMDIRERTLVSAHNDYLAEKTKIEELQDKLEQALDSAKAAKTQKEYDMYIARVTLIYNELLTRNDKLNDLKYTVEQATNKYKQSAVAFENNYDYLYGTKGLTDYADIIKDDIFIPSADTVEWLRKYKVSAEQNIATYNRYKSQYVPEDVNLADDVKALIFNVTSHKSGILQSSDEIAASNELIDKVIGDVKAVASAYKNAYNIYQEDMAQAVRAKNAGLISVKDANNAVTNAEATFAKVILSNTFANLSLLDWSSLNQQYAAYQMTLHPERYTNDESAQKLLEYRERVYGDTGTGTQQDAVRAAFQQLSAQLKLADDRVILNTGDLKRSSGNYYNMAQQLLVEFVTDPLNLVGVAASVADTVKVNKIAKQLSKDYGDVLAKAVVDSIGEGAPAWAMHIASNSNFSKARKELNKLMKKAVKTSINDDTVKSLGDAIQTVLAKDVASSVNKMATLGVDNVLVNVHLAESIDEMSRLVTMALATKDTTLDFTKNVTASALRGVDEVFDTVNRALTTAACPALGGAISLLSHIGDIRDWVKQGRVNKLLTEADALKFEKNLAPTLERVQAQLFGMNYDDVYNPATLATKVDSIFSEFSWAVAKDGAIPEGIAKLYNLTDDLLDNAIGDLMYGVRSDINAYLTQYALSDYTLQLAKADEYAVAHGAESFLALLDNLKKATVYNDHTFSKAYAVYQDIERNYRLILVKQAKAECAGYLNSIDSVIDDISKYISNPAQDVNPVIDKLMDLVGQLYYDVVDYKEIDMLTTVDRVLNLHNLWDGIDEEVAGAFISALDDMHTELSAYRKSMELYLQDTIYAGTKGFIPGRYAIDSSISGVKAAESERTINNIVSNIMSEIEDHGGDINATSWEDIVNNVLVRQEDLDAATVLKLKDSLYKIQLDYGTSISNMLHNESFMNFIDDAIDYDTPVGRVFWLNYNQTMDAIANAANPEMTVALQRRLSSMKDTVRNVIAVKCQRALYDELRTSQIIDDAFTRVSCLDAVSNKADTINRILDVHGATNAAREDITDLVVQRMQWSMSHQDDYMYLWDMNCNTGDVVSNFNNLVDACDIPADDKYIDVYYSIVGPNKGVISDIAIGTKADDTGNSIFLGLSNPDADFLLDDTYARRVFGTDANTVKDARLLSAATAARDGEDFINRIDDTMFELEQRARAEHKQLRFIGFNCTSANGGQNAQLREFLSYNGIHTYLNNSVDYADVIRVRNGMEVVSDAMYSEIRTAVNCAIDTWDLERTIHAMPANGVYDDIAHMAVRPDVDNILHGFDALGEAHQEIADVVSNIKEGLNYKAAEALGAARNCYIDTNALMDIIHSCGIKQDTFNVMKLVEGAVQSGSGVAGLREVVNEARINKFFDSDKLQKVLQSSPTENHVLLEKLDTVTRDIINTADNMKYMEAVQNVQFAELQDTIARFIDADAEAGLIGSSVDKDILRMYAVMDITKLPVEYQYSAMVHLINELPTRAKKRTYKYLYDTYNVQCAAFDLRFVKTYFSGVSIPNVDVPQAATVFLSTLDRDVQISAAISNARRSVESLKQYNDTLDLIFTANGLMSVDAKAAAVQRANILQSIDDLYKYSTEECVQESVLLKNFLDTFNLERISANDGTAYAFEIYKYSWVKEKLLERGVNLRQQSIANVFMLDDDVFEQHLVRNCKNMLLIDPASKEMSEFSELLAAKLDDWTAHGLKVEPVSLKPLGVDSEVLMVYKDLSELTQDDVRRLYSNVKIEFNPHMYTALESADGVKPKYMDNLFNNSTFFASDYSVLSRDNAARMQQLFPESARVRVDLFNDWYDSSFNCSVWGGIDLRRAVNPYASDNIINTTAQTAHMLRKNSEAVSDFFSFVNNEYTSPMYYIETFADNNRASVQEALVKFTDEIKGSDYHIVKLLNKDTDIVVADATDKFVKMVESGKHADVLDFFGDNSFAVIDSLTLRRINKWAEDKSKSLANTLRANAKVAEGMSAFGAAAARTQAEAQRTAQLYKTYIRSGTISTYLYGGVGTGVRNYTDSFSKALFEADRAGVVDTFMRAYADASYLRGKYEDISLDIMEEFHILDDSTIDAYFKEYELAGDWANKYKKLHALNLACGLGWEDLRANYLDTHPTDAFDNVFRRYANASTAYNDELARIAEQAYHNVKWAGYNSAELLARKGEISDYFLKLCDKHGVDFDAINKALGIDNAKELALEGFGNYKPRNKTLGEFLTEHTWMGKNKDIFDSAETRARYALAYSLTEGGYTVEGARKIIEATQFDYSKADSLLLPFMNYKKCNAMYWLSYADASATKFAVRAANANGDGRLSEDEINELAYKYSVRKYYLTNPTQRDEFAQYTNAGIAECMAAGITNYSGLPNEYTSAGSYMLGSRHVLKLGNSLVDELALLQSVGVWSGAMYAFVQSGDAEAFMRTIIESPLYDNMYGVWKTYVDFAVFKQQNNMDFNTALEMFIKANPGEALMGIPAIGAFINNLYGRAKNAQLNLGIWNAQLMDMWATMDFQGKLLDVLAAVGGTYAPSLIGTLAEDKMYDLGWHTGTSKSGNTTRYLDLGDGNRIYRYGWLNASNPVDWFDTIGYFQKLGFSEDQIDLLLKKLNGLWEGKVYISTKDFGDFIVHAFASGKTFTEIMNTISHIKWEDMSNSRPDRYLAMWITLPDYLKYDADQRQLLIEFWKSLGYSTQDAWGQLFRVPGYIDATGKFHKLDADTIARMNKRTNEKKFPSIDLDKYWNEYWGDNPYYYEKGAFGRTVDWLLKAGYTKFEAWELIKKGWYVTADGKLTLAKLYQPKEYIHFNTAEEYTSYILQTKYNSADMLEFIAKWCPPYLRYTKGAFKLTYTYLKSLGYKYAEILNLLSKGACVVYGPDGQLTLINCTGMTPARKTYTRKSWVNYPRYTRSNYSNSKRKWVTYPKRTYQKYDRNYQRTAYTQNAYNNHSYAMKNGKMYFKWQTFTNRPLTDGRNVSTYSVQNVLSGASYGARQIYKTDLRQSLRLKAMSIKSAVPSTYRNIVYAYRRNLYKDLYAKYGTSRMVMRTNKYSNAPSTTRLRREQVNNRKRYEIMRMSTIRNPDTRANRRIR